MKYQDFINAVERKQTDRVTYENIYQYVKQYLKDDHIRRDFLQWLQLNPQLQSIVHIPVHLSLTCWLWRHEKIQGRMTVSKLYQKIVERRVIQFEEDTNIPERKQFEHVTLEQGLKFLSALAFYAMQNIQYEFDADTILNYLKQFKAELLLEINEILLFKNALQLGFLTSVQGTDTLSQDDTYYFVHLIFQEFFAAQYLAEGYVSDRNSTAYQEACQILREHKYNPRYENVWYFVSGILANRSESESVNHFFDLWKEEPKDLLNFVDRLMLIRLWEEAQGKLFPKHEQGLISNIQSLLANEFEFNQALITALRGNSYVIRQLKLESKLILQEGDQSEIKRQKIYYIVKLEFFTDLLQKSLVKALSDPEVEVRLSAVKALRELGLAATPEVMLALVKALADPEGEIQFRATLTPNVVSASAVPAISSANHLHLQEDSENSLRTSFS